MSNEIIDFWFNEIKKKQWWTKDKEFDHLLQERFGKLHKQASACELHAWRTSPEGRLAEIIILDQFSRNIYRDTPQAFTQDNLALVLAQEAVACGDDQKLDAQKRFFLYMPYMHSESLIIHEQAEKLFSSLPDKGNLDYEIKHKKIIERFGRYPHRNDILGRTSTDEEIQFLQEPDSSF